MTNTDRSACTAARHGDQSAYSWSGCRCPDAREAWRLYKKRLREGRQPSAYTNATGTARRVQALCAIGYSYADLGRHLGLSRRRVGNLAAKSTPLVTRRAAAMVRDLYERLSATPGPSSYGRTVARRYGWVPPAAWEDIDDPNAVPDVGGCGEHVVDEEAIRRCLRGALRFGELRRNEQVVAYQQLADQGLTGNQIRVRLRVNVETIRRLAQSAAELDGAAA